MPGNDKDPILGTATWVPRATTVQPGEWSGVWAYACGCEENECGMFLCNQHATHVPGCRCEACL